MSQMNCITGRQAEVVMVCCPFVPFSVVVCLSLDAGPRGLI